MKKRGGGVVVQMTVEQGGQFSQVALPAGETILAALQKAGLAPPEAPCGGKGRCGKCTVTMVGVGQVLACQTVVSGDCHVILTERAPMDVLCQGVVVPFPRDGQPTAGWGVAVDIGTTTVALQLYDLADGTLLATVGEGNRQRVYGGDVISRISHTMEHPQGLDQLTHTITDQLGDMIRTACHHAGGEPCQVVSCVLAGNTVMEHLVTGLSPATIAVAPFTPQSTFGGNHPQLTAPLGLGAHCTVYLAPCLSGYVGGDITAGLLAVGGGTCEDTILFLDVGTNGEMAIGTGGAYLCCSTAAGPAFEGANISQGMGAVPGAISRVWLEGEAVRYETVGGLPAIGICGSGLLDGLAAMLTLGAVEETGRLLPPAEAPAAAVAYLEERADGVAFRLGEHCPIAITAQDVRKCQLAKGAVAAGVETLLKTTHRTTADIAHVYLAGGFGSHLRRESVATIGLIPGGLADKLTWVGNTAAAGAAALLLSQTARRQLADLVTRCQYLELSGLAAFNQAYMDCMLFEEGKS